MHKVGLIINPVAGMGGKVGLKGSDGIEIMKRAVELGAEPESPRRALETLRIISVIKDSIEIITWGGKMGEDTAREAGFQSILAGETGGITTPEDTINAARMIVKMGADLLLFAGGDGTARNICHAICDKVPVIGIPAGVKIHSAVFAVNPTSAGKAVIAFFSGKAVTAKEKEVMDIDEDAFRNGIVKAKLYGYMKVPELKTYMQSVKSGNYSEKEAIQGIAEEVVTNMEKDVAYIIGPGTTTRPIMEKLGLENTLLGIDVVLNKQAIINDATEKQIYEFLEDRKAKIIVTAIGGQGHIFGRGNQQISPRVIRKVGKENIIVIAGKVKLLSLLPAPLLVDTGDADLDNELCGYIRVITGFEDYITYNVRT